MKLLVAGCGSIGRRHLANLRTLDAGELLACDPDQAALDHVKAPGVRTFTRLGDALERGPDAVLVCTPTHQHLEVAAAAIAAGAHVFLEKPVSSSLDGTEALSASARSRGSTVIVGCNMRFHPGVAHLKEALDTGVVKAPLYFRARSSHYLPQWRPGQDYRLSYSASSQQGGGVILEGVHEIDYLTWLGGDIARLAASGGRLSDLDIDVEDYALLLLQFASGAVAQVHLDYLSPFKLRGCEIVGTEGVVRWESEGKSPEVIRVQHFDRSTGRAEDVYRCASYDSNEMYLEQMRRVLACLSGGAESSLLRFDGACRLLGVALAAQRAVRAEETVPDGPFRFAETS